MLTLDIVLLIHFTSKSIRYYHTEKIFKYFNYLSNVYSKDLSFLCGSNDLIFEKFFSNLIDKYSNKENLIYGINRNNYVIFHKLNNKIKLNKNNIIHIWDGIYPESNNIPELCGGIIGFNNKLFNNL